MKADKSTACLCNKDCFHCVHPDCINDWLDYDDYLASEEMERDFLFPKTQKERRRAEQDRRYRKKNKETIAARDRAYREANKEAILAQQRTYRETNRDKVAARKHAYYEANKEKAAVQQRAYREANREKIAARARAYREANKDAIAAQKRAYRKARKERLASQAVIRTAGAAHALTQVGLAQKLSVTDPCLSGWHTVALQLVRRSFASFCQSYTNRMRGRFFCIPYILPCLPIG